jgi:hypothetical protein
MGGIPVHPVFRAILLDTQAYLDAADGRLDAAGAARAEALGLVLGTWDGLVASRVLVGIADQAVAVGRPADAVRLLVAAVGSRGGPDCSLPDEARVEAEARMALGDAAADAARREAEASLADGALHRDDALALGRDVAAAVLAPVSAPAPG